MILNVAFVVAIAVATSASTTGTTQNKNGLMLKLLALQQNRHIKESVQKNTTTTTTEIKSIYNMINSFHSINSTQAPSVHVHKASIDEDKMEPKPLLIASLGAIIFVTLFLFIFHSGWCCELDRLYRRNTPQTTNPTPRVITLVTVSRSVETPPPTPPQSPPPPYHLFAPPSYEDVVSGRINCPVLIVPVHSAPSGQ